MEVKIFCKIWVASILQLPMTTPRQSDFFNSNLTVAFILSIFSDILSDFNKRVGNFPALFKPGPNIRGIVFINDSDARKKSYFFANFLMIFFWFIEFF